MKFFWKVKLAKNHNILRITFTEVLIKSQFFRKFFIPPKNICFSVMPFGVKSCFTKWKQKQAEKTSKSTLPIYRARKIGKPLRGITKKSYRKITKNFLSGGPFGVSGSLKYQKTLCILRRAYGDPSVFSEVSGIEKLCIGGGGGGLSQFFIEFFVSKYQKLSQNGLFWCFWVLSCPCFRLYLNHLL